MSESAATFDALNRILTGLTYSTAAYILESNPYTSDKDKKVLGLLREIAKSDAGLAVEYVKAIESLDEYPRTGAPSPHLASLNYLSFPYLLESAIKDHKRRIAFLEKTASGVSDESLRALLNGTVAAKKAELASMEGLLASDYAPAEAATA